MAGHPGATTLGIVSAFLLSPIQVALGARWWFLERRVVRRWLGFCCYIGIMGLQDQLAPPSDDPHAVFALKGRN